MKRNLTTKRDNLVVQYIQQHVGKDNSVTSKDIVEHLKQNGFTLKAECVHVLVTELIFERCLPICSKKPNGYYWGGCKQDLLVAIEHLQSKVDGLQKHIDHLKKFIIE